MRDEGGGGRGGGSLIVGQQTALVRKRAVLRGTLFRGSSTVRRRSSLRSACMCAPGPFNSRGRSLHVARGAGSHVRRRLLTTRGKGRAGRADAIRYAAGVRGERRASSPGTNRGGWPVLRVYICIRTHCATRQYLRNVNTVVRQRGTRREGGRGGGGKGVGPEEFPSGSRERIMQLRRRAGLAPGQLVKK